MHGEKIHAYGMHKLEQFCAHCGLAVKERRFSVRCKMCAPFPPVHLELNIVLEY